MRTSTTSAWRLLSVLIAVLVCASLAISQETTKPETTKPETPKPAVEEDEEPRERNRTEEAAEVVIHEWSLMVADPTTERINAADLYPAGVPAQVETIRSRKPLPGAVLPSPMSMMTFTGKPVTDIEIDLRVPNGRVLSHWPPGKYKNGRLRWLDFALTEGAPTAPAPIPVPQGHWFKEARSEGLYLKSSARSERFLTYDVEHNFNTDVKLAGGSDKYQVINAGSATLSDVLVSVPTKEGRRIGWLDELPVTKGASSSQPAPTPAPGATPGTPATGAPTVPAVAPAAASAADAPAPAAAANPAPAAGVVAEFRAVAAEKDDAEVKEAVVAAEKAEAAKATDQAKPAGVAAERAAAEQNAAAEKKKAEVVAQEQKAKAAVIAAEAAKAAAEGKPVEPKPADAKPSDSKPIETKPGDPKPAEAKPAEVKAAAPVGVDIVMSKPLSAGSAEYKSQTSEALRARLVKAGLTDSEAALLLSIYEKAIFGSEDMVVLYRVPQSMIDDKLPLTVYPDAKKIVRVGLVLVRNLDPQISSDIQELVAKLGDPKFSVREAASKRLALLGALATPALKEAVKSSDAETAYRAEQILQEQEPDENGQPRARVRAARLIRAG